MAETTEQNQAPGRLQIALQRINEWGNTHSGALAVAGVVIAGLLVLRRR